MTSLASSECLATPLHDQDDPEDEISMPISQWPSISVVWCSPDIVPKGVS